MPICPPIDAELTLDEDDAYAEAAQLELYGGDADDFEISDDGLEEFVAEDSSGGCDRCGGAGVFCSSCEDPPTTAGQE